MGFFDFLKKGQVEKKNYVQDSKVLSNDVENIKDKEHKEVDNRKTSKVVTKRKKRKLSPTAYANITRARKTSTAGRDKIPMFHYSKDGKFLTKFESTKEVLEKYYGRTTGYLLTPSESYKQLPDGTFICRTRMGREKLRKTVSIDNSIYCKTFKNNNPIEVYNLKNECIATFSCAGIASAMTGVHMSTILNSLGEVRKRTKAHGTPSSGLSFRYKK